MQKDKNNFAYIDGTNLHKGVNRLGWKIDYRRLRLWLKNKYGVERAYVFLGMVTKYTDIYNYLQNAGFIIVFKETTHDGDGKIKGNCDADLVLWSVRDVYESKFDRAILVSSDGDYASLVQFLQEKNKLLAILSPSNHCSILLKRTGARITYLDWVKHKICRK